MSEIQKVPERFSIGTSANNTLIMFKQLKRVGDVAIYVRENVWGGKQWEVVVIRVTPEQTIEPKNGSGEVYTYPESERYPSSSQWGTYGWTYLSLEKATEKMEELLRGN